MRKLALCLLLVPVMAAAQESGPTWTPRPTPTVTPTFTPIPWGIEAPRQAAYQQQIKLVLVDTRSCRDCPSRYESRLHVVTLDEQGGIFSENVYQPERYFPNAVKLQLLQLMQWIRGQLDSKTLPTRTPTPTPMPTETPVPTSTPGPTQFPTPN